MGSLIYNLISDVDKLGKAIQAVQQDGLGVKTCDTLKYEYKQLMDEVA